jgi:hypothetical protein
MAHEFLECFSDTDHLISRVIDGVVLPSVGLFETSKDMDRAHHPPKVQRLSSIIRIDACYLGLLQAAFPRPDFKLSSKLGSGSDALTVKQLASIKESSLQHSANQLGRQCIAWLQVETHVSVNIHLHKSLHFIKLAW